MFAPDFSLIHLLESEKESSDYFWILRKPMVLKWIIDDSGALHREFKSRVDILLRQARDKEEKIRSLQESVESRRDWCSPEVKNGLVAVIDDMTAMLAETDETISGLRRELHAERTKPFWKRQREMLLEENRE